MLASDKTLDETYDFHAFSLETLDNTLKEYSTPVYFLNVLLAVLLVLVYTGFNFFKYKDPVNGQCGVGIAGIILIFITTTAALGFCALFGPYNVATTQVVPYLAIGLGINHIYILIHAYDIRRSNNEQMNLENILKKSGPSVLFNGASTACAFFIAALCVPIPILRNFALQTGIVICFNLLAVFSVFPAFIEYDLRRRRRGSLDMLCCLPSINHTPEITIEDYPPKNQHGFSKRNNNIDTEATRETMDSLIGAKQPGVKRTFSFTERFVSKYYINFISNAQVKKFGIFSFSVIMIASSFAVSKLTYGFELTDLLPKNTNDYRFLNVQNKLFGFYNMYAVTKGDFEYPTNQKLIYEYHEAFIKVSSVIKNDNGGLPDFWLSLFRDWLLNLQDSFDRDYRDGKITREQWYSNASDDSILAYKLLAQTGHVDNPVDKALISYGRLVDKDGIINPKGFYNYLSAWAWNDALGYSASQVIKLLNILQTDLNFINFFLLFSTG